VTGFQAISTAGRRIGKVSVAVPLFIAGGIINEIFDYNDESFFERERRKRPWKQYWRERPDENPAMHEAFKDDYG